MAEDRAHRPGQPQVRPERLRHGAAQRATCRPSASSRRREYQDGHAGYSDPIDEQHFLVNEINAIQKSKYWSSTAIVIAYDDSDGWYDHVALDRSRTPRRHARTTRRSAPTVDRADRRRLPGPLRPGPATAAAGASRRASKTNYVDHTPIEQASVLQFIEDNWFTGRIGDASFDAKAGQLNTLFNFANSNNKRVMLKQDGSIKSITPVNGGKVRNTT